MASYVEKSTGVFTSCLKVVSCNLFFLARCLVYTLNRMLFRQFVINDISKNVVSFLWSLRDLKAMPFSMKGAKTQLDTQARILSAFPAGETRNSMALVCNHGLENSPWISGKHHCTAGLFRSRLVLSLLCLSMPFFRNGIKIVRPIAD